MLILGLCLIPNMLHHVLFITIHSQYPPTDTFPQVLAGVDLTNRRTNHYHIMRHHSLRPRPSPPVTRRPDPCPAVPHSPPPSLPMPGRPPQSPAVLTHSGPSPTVPGCPDSSPTAPGSPSPLPCTNVSHPVGPAVLPKDGRPALRADGTDYCQPSRPVRGSWQSPGRLGTLSANVPLSLKQTPVSKKERQILH